MNQEAAVETASDLDDFEALLAESFITQDNLEGNVVNGTIIAIENDNAIIDVGLKTEGRIAVKEFTRSGEDISVGDKIDVFLERIENAVGEAVLSRDKARREEAWNHLEVAYDKNERVEGAIIGRVKGGFTVDLSGAVAFLPGSQVDIRPVRDIGPLIGLKQPFQILKMDRRRGNIVVSRRAVLEETRAEQRSEIVANLAEGQVLEGVVKNITDYGAFVDLGGVDGLLHVTDMAWRRVNHPSEALGIGETVKVQIIKVNPETQRISLGMKQLEADPWEGVAAKYPQDSRFKGRVTNITDYGAFVELEAGVEGLVHVSEMSWTKKNVHPGKIVSTSQEVEVQVLDVDPEKRRISLGLKQCLDNPWLSFETSYPVGSTVEGEIKNITEFGLFVGLDHDLDGMVHMSDLDWNRSGDEAIADYTKGDMVQAKILDIDTDKERISLGIKQLADDPFTQVAGAKKGEIVTCTVAKIQEHGIEVTVGENMTAFIKKIDLSRDRSEQKPDRFAVGDKVDARVTNIDKSSRRITLSIKAREIQEEKEAVAQYGSSDSGASLGDILGPAFRARAEAGDEDEGEAEGDVEVEAAAEAEAEPAAEAEAAPVEDASVETSEDDADKPAAS
jgi:small subunit ribosomal protein S1